MYFILLMSFAIHSHRSTQQTTYFSKHGRDGLTDSEESGLETACTVSFDYRWRVPGEPEVKSQIFLSNIFNDLTSKASLFDLIIKNLNITDLTIRLVIIDGNGDDWGIIHTYISLDYESIKCFTHVSYLRIWLAINKPWYIQYVSSDLAFMCFLWH